MTPEQQQSVVLQLTGAILISVLSGAISLGRRILRYGRVPVLGMLTEMTAAILAGYLAWDAYPGFQESLPHGVTRAIFVSACAYMGGRLFQHVETLFESRTYKPEDKAPK